MSHAYHPHCGCFQCGRTERSEELREQYIERLVEAFRADPLKVAEADSWVDGTMSGEHYSAVERALADLHDKQPADLLGSDVLTRLYDLAKAQNAERMKHLRFMAEQDVDRSEAA